MKKFIVITFCLLLLIGCSKPRQDIIQPEVYTKAETDQKFSELDESIQQSFDLVTEQTKILDSLTRLNKEEFNNYRRKLTAIKIPDSVYFCGSRVLLEFPDVRQRFEKQVYLIADNQAQIILYLLRAKLFFPIIEEMLANDSMPDDLKFIAVIESALKSNARSRAKAQGFWQFIKPTAKTYKINNDKYVDMRNDLIASTKGAIAYFKKLYKQFDNDWPLALAAYNMGEWGLKNKIDSQKVSDYYQLVLPIETEQYVPRAAAVKLILENPGNYGIAPETINYWEEMEQSDTLTITVRNKLMVIWVADWCETTYRQIKLLNTSVKNDRWGPGRHLINIPSGTREMFFEGLTSIKRGEYKPY